MRTYLIDDEPALRESFSALLSVFGKPCVAFEDAESFLEEFDGQNRSCVFCDVNLPGMNGLQLLDRIADKTRGSAAVVMITGLGDVPLAVRAMQAGAIDFIEKPVSPERVEEALTRAEALFAENGGGGRKAQAAAAIAGLTERECAVVEKLANGRPNKVAAYELGISPRTIEVHRAHIMEKTGAGSFAELVRMAIDADLV